MPSFSKQGHSPNPQSNLFRLSFPDSKMSQSSPRAGAESRESKLHHGVDRVARELTRYLGLLKPSPSDGVHGSHGNVEELMTTPLFSWSTKVALQDLRKRGRLPEEAHFDQFALLGRERGEGNNIRSAENPEGVEPVFLNTNAPWSAFLCGSQGSGKSHTLACMLEGCLMQSKSLGRLPEPLQGIVFHYDNSGSICEAAHLCSMGIKVNVLVSPSNYWRLKGAYEQIDDQRSRLKVRELRLQPKHLSAQRMMALMAFSESGGKVPLYMEVISRILRDMATSEQGQRSFDYNRFLTLLNAERFTGDQKGPMSLRLQLLESFMDLGNNVHKPAAGPKADIFRPEPGSLTIVDLTDPFVDPSSACTLFDICLALFLEDNSSAGRVIALDEAHKYMGDSSAANKFTESLLTCIRIQRHVACRIIIATQEPTISPKLLDLCSMTIVHRFTSPAWLVMLRSHLAGLSAVAGKSEEEVQKLFEEIVTLRVGESLLFSPSAMIRVNQGEIKKLGTECVRFKTRPRVTNDGGRSIMAIR